MHINKYFLYTYICEKIMNMCVWRICPIAEKELIFIPLIPKFFMFYIIENKLNFSCTFCVHDVYRYSQINRFVLCVRSCMPNAWRRRFSSNLRESKTPRYPFTESFHLRVFGGLLKLHNWISPGKSEAKARYQWYTTNAVVFTRGPLRLRVSTQELILHRHCLVGYTTSRDFPFFSPRSSIPLFHPPFC